MKTGILLFVLSCVVVIVSLAHWRRRDVKVMTDRFTNVDIDQQLTMNTGSAVGGGVIQRNLDASGNNNLLTLIDSVEPLVARYSIQAGDTSWTNGAPCGGPANYTDHTNANWCFNHSPSGPVDPTRPSLCVGAMESFFCSGTKFVSETYDDFFGTDAVDHRYRSGGFNTDGSSSNQAFEATTYAFNDWAPGGGDAIFQIVNATPPGSGQSSISFGGSTGGGANVSIRSDGNVPLIVQNNAQTSTLAEITVGGADFATTGVGHGHSMSNTDPNVATLELINTTGGAGAQASIEIEAVNGTKASTISVLTTGDLFVTAPAGGIILRPAGTETWQNTAGTILMTLDQLGNLMLGSGGTIAFQLGPDGTLTEKNGAGAFIVSIRPNGHLTLSGPTLTTSNLSSCGGTGIAISGTDRSGFITEGAAATGCVLTFAQTYGTKPACTLSAESGTAIVYVPTPTSLTISTATTAPIHYNCSGLSGSQ